MRGEGQAVGERFRRNLYDSQFQTSSLQIPGHKVSYTELGGRKPCSLLVCGTLLCSDQLRAGGLSSTGGDRGLGTSSVAFMMGSSGTDSFQVTLREADQKEPEQEGEDRVDPRGCGSWGGSTNDTSCWGRPEIAGGHGGQAEIPSLPL